jgi:16S rRNA (cytosine1402-N4)-methyltransferase
VSERFLHHPVLAGEVVRAIPRRSPVVVVDATVGGGGHAAAILDGFGPEARLVGLDVDADALAAASRRLERFGDRVLLIRSNFRRLRTVLGEIGLASVDAVVIDLGVSSWQLDAPRRGFRFSEAASDVTPLDMRMDLEGRLTAADLLRHASAAELERIFREYGELPGARRLAREIVEERRHQPLATSADLLRAIRRSGVGSGRNHHPATLVYQALRIAVNDELAALNEGLDAAIGALSPGGRLIVIAYHSLEDRRVKQRIAAEVRGCICPPRAPVCTCGRSPRLRNLTRRPITPGPTEIAENPRSRSARLRIAERLASPLSPTEESCRSEP